MKFEFSRHALEQMEARHISRELVKQILAKPEQTVEGDGYKVYQTLMPGRKFLIRIFINDKTKVITVYKTSKIKKYYEGKI